jgi:SagB-type dehydrogenase family enzyme
MFVLANRVTGLAPGLWRFLAVEHALVEHDLSPGIASRVVKGCLGQEMVGRSAATFLWAAVPYRMSWRYGERGYRYLLLDAGHACHGLSLAAEAIECGACAIAAFDDDAMDAVLGLDGSEKFTIYIAAVGKKEGDRTDED